MSIVTDRVRSATMSLIVGSVVVASSVAGASVASAEPTPPSVSSSAGEVVSVTPEDVAAVNATLAGQGRSPLPAGTAGFKVKGDATVVIVDRSGNVLQRPSTAADIQARGVTDEIKRVVGACIGIDLFAAVGAWEAIESQVNSWDKAAKFVLRRVGLIAAITCGGGIFAEYLL